MSRTRTLALLSLIAATACGGHSRYLNPNSDLGTLRTVAILPFENVTPDKLATERTQRIFLTELLATGAFEVVEPGLVLRTIRREQGDASTFAPEDFKRIGESLKAQAFFLGTVLEWEDPRVGAAPAPRVTLQRRLVDAETGKTVWSTTRTKAGASWSARLFGIGGRTATGTAEELIRDELSALLR